MQYRIDREEVQQIDVILNIQNKAQELAIVVPLVVKVAQTYLLFLIVVL